MSGSWLTICCVAAAVAAQPNPSPQLAEKFGNLLQAGRYSEAEAVGRQGLAISQQAGQAEWVNTWLGKLGGLYSQQNRPADAEKAYRQLLPLEERVRGPQSFEVAVCLRRLGEACEAQQHRTEAAEAYKRSLEIAEKLAGPENPNTAMAMEDLALVYAELKRDAEAEDLLKRSLAIRIKILGTEHLHTAAGSINLAWFYAKRDRPAEAEPLFRRAVAIYAKQLGPGSAGPSRPCRACSVPASGNCTMPTPKPARQGAGDVEDGPRADARSDLRVREHPGLNLRAPGTLCRGGTFVSRGRRDLRKRQRTRTYQHGGQPQ